MFCLSPGSRGLRCHHLEIIFTVFTPKDFVGLYFSAEKNYNSWKFLVFSVISLCKRGRQPFLLSRTTPSELNATATFVFTDHRTEMQGDPEVVITTPERPLAVYAPVGSMNISMSTIIVTNPHGQRSFKKANDKK